MASRTMRRRASYRALGSHAAHGSHPLLNILVVLLVSITMVTSGASAATIFFYGQNLPSIKNFQSKFDFQNTLIRDSQGHVLYDMADLSAKRGRRVIEPLQWPGHPTSYYKSQSETWLVGSNARRGLDPGIPVILQNATIATEDSSFWSNPGFDPLSIARATYDNFTQGQVVSGASTITQQLVRRYLLDPNNRTLTRKAKEVILAAELTQKYPKSEILWYYLNSVPYGNLAVGAEAAAQNYFHTDVWNLDLAQSAMLAGLPEAPTIYNPVTNLPAALNRMRYVLHLMYAHGYLTDGQGHPDVSLINQAMAETRDPKKFPKFSPPVITKKYPHFVQYAIDQLQTLSQTVPSLRGRLFDGLDVYTTLNPQLQDAAQQIVRNQISQLGSYNVSDGALVSIDVRSGCRGCILAMVGSANFNQPGGEINMADTPRQPGSSFKPFNYIYGFRHGLSPGTSVLDGPVDIPDPGNPEDGGVYSPTDYDQTWHGVVTLRTALDNSLNAPAIRVEQFAASTANGDVRDTVGHQAVVLGVKSLFQDNPHCCGWSLTLGGLERGLRLVEETSAYGTFATLGVTDPPIAIKFVYDRTTGKLLYDYRRDRVDQPQRVLDPGYAYIMNNVLSDNSARCGVVCEFGLDSPLYLGRTAAAKTGTTNSFTDNWTVGYTPDIVTGVWVGNADNSPMIGTTGVTGAAPIWHDFMLAAFQKLNLPPDDWGSPPSDVYTTSECREPGPYLSYSTMGPDLSYAGTVPYCYVGDASSSLPAEAPAVQPQPAPAAPVAPAAPAAAPPTAVPQAPAAQGPAAQPTAVAPSSQAPAAQAPAVAPQAPVQQPVPPPTAQAPAIQPPSSQAPPPANGPVP